MDKTAVKNYAVKARKDLIEAVKVKAQQLYIFEDSTKTLRPGKETERLQADGIFLSPAQLKARGHLYSELTSESILYGSKIYNRKMEEIAYIWFNRLIALRFMEVNEYLPSNIRILSSVEQGRIEPEAMREADRLDYVDQRKIAKFRTDTDINASEKLYKYILIQQCNALSAILPGMFEKIDDYTELLLPDTLLAKGGIVYDFVNSIHEDNFSIKKQGQIEIIGWLYQYYISEKKDEVFAALKKNVKINKDTIPAATQLFTPEWIVKYMVENSLGRLWLESNPNDELRKEWKYYVDEAEQEPKVAEQLSALRSQNPIKRPEDIKLIDPCMGSGHILVYAFDVLYQIYQSVGYFEREIPNLILQHNIYGLDIDDRACQLTYFALMMKARGYNRRFFRQENIPQPMVYSAKGDSELEEYGSLLKVTDLGEKPELHEQIAVDDLNYEKKLNAWNYRNLLAQKYDVVVTNPPYMSPAPAQADWIKKNYPDSKSDLCVVFIERNFDFLKQSGYLSMITMHSWMFLSSYEKFREKLIGTKDIINMAHLGARAFEEIGGEVVQTTAFIMRRSNIADYLASYARLVDLNSQQAKEEAFLSESNRHTAKKGNFEKIPGMSVAYWVSDLLVRIFEINPSLGRIAEPRQGMATADNNRFLREWFEVSATKRNVKWFPYSKGGSFRKWYGNSEYYLNWENDGAEIKAFSGSVIRNPSYYFKQGLAWSALTSGSISFRYLPEGYLFDSKGPVCYPLNGGYLHSLLGLVNSNSAMHFLKILAPTLDFNQGPISKIPVPKEFQTQTIDNIVINNISISRDDWDSFETSWDFARHPLLATPASAEAPPSRKGAGIGALPQPPSQKGVPSADGGGCRPYNAALKPFARELRTNATRHENHLWYDFLRNFRPRFTRQRIVGQYILDFYCAKAHLAVELDGSQHFEPDAVEYDKNRTEALNEWGIEVVRFTNAEIDENFDGVCDMISTIVAERQPPLSADGTPFTEGDRGVVRLSDVYAEWELECENRFQNLKSNEEELNRIFIDIYGLQDELTPEVEDKDVTVRKADLWREIRSLISYAVGCMFGRYSLDEDGIVFAGGKFDMLRYTAFKPTEDNIIPVNSNDYFDSDIVVRFVEFIRIAFGENTLGENIAFIADVLYPNANGTAQERIRRYFLSDFYKDHLKIYQKRPIYWLLDSGKKDGFKALFYLHRYDKYTVSRARTDYLHPLQRKYDAEIKRLEMLSGETENAREKSVYRKEINILQGKMDECRIYDQVVSHIAHQQIELDLDDGVKVNYEKFQGVEVPKDNGKSEIMDLLGRI